MTVLRFPCSMLTQVNVATDKKNPNKGAGVWYLQTSRQRSACCAVKSVGYPGKGNIFSVWQPLMRPALVKP
uniref:Uncharacterized protein n=1 Tax=Erwinia amylovora ATCC BAA-2158 TaxID=889211 RepID=E5B6D2_ERWAM|nr:hypothetical protein predicted by Glimmer/Critica [Erwinia amylovora ATCC BAA-2158]